MTRPDSRTTARGSCAARGCIRCPELLAMLKMLRPLIPAFAFVAAPVLADGPFHNRDNKNPNDSGEPTYPVPYQLPTVAEITEALGRVRGFLESATPTRL